MTVVRIELLDAAFKARIAKAIAANQDARPLMAAWAIDILGSVEEVAAKEGVPRWAALSKLTTIPRRKAAGTYPGKTLQVTGKLMASIQPSHGADFAVVSTNDVRAKPLHFGAKQGAFGRDKRNHPLPWGNIPARPFMVLLPAVETEMVKRGLDWVSGRGA